MICDSIVVPGSYRHVNMNNIIELWAGHYDPWRMFRLMFTWGGPHDEDFYPQAWRRQLEKAAAMNHRQEWMARVTVGVMHQHLAKALRHGPMSGELEGWAYFFDLHLVVVMLQNEAINPRVEMWIKDHPNVKVLFRESLDGMYGGPIMYDQPNVGRSFDYDWTENIKYTLQQKYVSQVPAIYPVSFQEHWEKHWDELRSSVPANHRVMAMSPYVAEGWTFGSLMETYGRVLHIALGIMKGRVFRRTETDPAVIKVWEHVREAQARGHHGSLHLECPVCHGGRCWVNTKDDVVVVACEKEGCYWYGKYVG